MFVCMFSTFFLLLMPASSLGSHLHLSACQFRLEVLDTNGTLNLLINFQCACDCNIEKYNVRDQINSGFMPHVMVIVQQHSEVLQHFFDPMIKQNSTLNSEECITGDAWSSDIYWVAPLPRVNNSTEYMEINVLGNNLGAEVPAAKLLKYFSHAEIVLELGKIDSSPPGGKDDLLINNDLMVVESIRYDQHNAFNAVHMDLLSIRNRYPAVCAGSREIIDVISFRDKIVISTIYGPMEYQVSSPGLFSDGRLLFNRCVFVLPLTDDGAYVTIDRDDVIEPGFIPNNTNRLEIVDAKSGHEAYNVIYILLKMTSDQNNNEELYHIAQGRNNATEIPGHRSFHLSRFNWTLKNMNVIEGSFSRLSVSNPLTLILWGPDLSCRLV